MLELEAASGFVVCRNNELLIACHEVRLIPLIMQAVNRIIQYVGIVLNHRLSVNLMASLKLLLLSILMA